MGEDGVGVLPVENVGDRAHAHPGAVRLGSNTSPFLGTRISTMTSPRELDALILVPSSLLVAGAGYGAVRGTAFIVSGKVNRADEPTLSWSTVSASALLGATGMLVVRSQAAGRIGSHDLRAYSLMLVLAALLGQGTLSSVQRGETGYFYSSVRRFHNPGKFRWAIGLFAALSCLLIATVIFSVIFQPL